VLQTDNSCCCAAAQPVKQSTAWLQSERSHGTPSRQQVHPQERHQLSM
jgi:hypothetical protein